MKTVLIDRERDFELSDTILSYLPFDIAQSLRSLPCPKIDEIRLRNGGCCSVTSNGRNIPFGRSLTRPEIDSVLRKMCDGSLYAYSDTINKGYVTLSGGIRVGIGGRAVTEKGKIIGVYDVSTLCIRIPHNISGVGGSVERLLRGSDFTSGVLVYSRPGVGKTTLLRSVISSLASGASAVRVAVIDTRGELCCRLPSGLSLDVLSGYPKGVGIEIAARTLNPQLIVCDEIGGELAEAESIRAAHNCGVPLLATAHASGVSGLLKRTGISILHEAAIFGHYVGITRTDGVDYKYNITPYWEADRVGS